MYTVQKVWVVALAILTVPGYMLGRIFAEVLAIDPVASGAVGVALFVATLNLGLIGWAEGWTGREWI